MEVIVERPAALDVHKAQVTACVRVPAEAGERHEQIEEFKTTVCGLLVLRDWLKAHRVTQVTMEATGVYWKPVWHVLEDDFELILVNAAHVKQVPGRKTDVADAQWLCRLAEAGLLRASFVPPKPIRELRALTRYRKAQILERQREANRLHKALEDTGIKLDCVATNILGVSGRAMLDALVAGTTDPEVLADLAKGRMRAKIAALREALEGRFDAHHALLIGAILSHLDFLDEQIGLLSEAIEAKLAPFGAVHDPGDQAAHRREHPRRDRHRHDAVPQRRAARLLGRPVPRQSPVRGQAQVRSDPQGVKVAEPGAQGGRTGRDEHERLLPAGALSPQEGPGRTQQGTRRRQALDDLRDLAHALHRRALHRPRPRPLRPTQPRTPDQAPRRTARTPRTQRHAAGSSGSLNVIFPSDG